MTPSEFLERFGCTPEEYADKMAGKLKATLGRKEADQDAARLHVAMETLSEELNRHFRQAVSEGIVKEWTLTVTSAGERSLSVVSVKEYADIFRARGFKVQEG